MNDGGKSRAFHNGRAAVALLVLASGAGCSGGGSSSGPGGGGGTVAGGGRGGSTGIAGAAGSGGGGAAAGVGGSGGGFVNAAVCGERGSGTASATDYQGTAQFYIIGEAGLGVDVCTVQFDVKRVGAAPAGCTDCSWTHLVEYSNPTVVTNTDGACDASDSIPALDVAGRGQVDGSRVGRGFSKLAGHGDQLMKWEDAMQKWVAIGRASWDEPSSDLGYDIRTGTCNYGH